MTSNVQLHQNTFFEEVCASITLGLLCGWYYFLLFFFYPALLFGIFIYKSWICAGVMVVFIVISVIPLDHTPRRKFMRSWIFKIWRNYFGFKFDVTKSPMKEGERYLFCEFPHAIFPMGQFISASVIEDAFPGQMICGTGADIIFAFPVMRHLMAWIGTRPATRKGIKDILKSGSQVAIIPGGIAEMYLVNETTEAIYLRKRHSTVRMAIQEGLHLIPAFFFGNSKIFSLVGGGKQQGDAAGADRSWLATLSRKFRMSIVFFYGRFFLPIPLKHPIQMVTGPPIPVTQNDAPSDEEVEKVLHQLIEGVKTLYEESKPEWETRPLIVL